MRKIVDTANIYAKKHCDKTDIQFLALAKRSTRLAFSKKSGVYWHSIFDMEFSGDRESSNQAVLILNNLTLVDVTMPVYRMP